MTEAEPEGRPQLDLVFANRQGRTVLERRLFRWPFVLTRTFALDPIPSGMLTVILQTSSGAVHGEDRLAQRFAVRAGAAVHVTTQGASSIHRAGPGLMARDRVCIHVEAGGFLEYLPEPRILFPGAALEQSIAVDCASGGVALIADAFTTHDPDGRGRCFDRLTATTTLRCGDSDPSLVDRMDIRGLGRSGATGYTSFGSVLLALPGRADLQAMADHLTGRLDRVPDLYGAASLLPGGESGIGLRLAGRSLRAVREGIQSVWIGTRHLLYGAPPGDRRRGNNL